MRRIDIVLVLLLCSMISIAQTYQQKGIVRTITTSATAVAALVEGVKVVIGNTQSRPTDASGSFNMQVKGEFQVNDVISADYILALPTKGATYYYSKNNLDVVVISKADQQAEYKKLYNRLKDKYDAQADELMALKRKYQRKVNELDQSDAAYAKAKAQLDSV